jgi:hypothetical protein
MGTRFTFPDDAPILYVTRNGIPKVTLDEIRRLGDTGIVRDHNVDVIAVGAAANPGVLGQLSALGLRSDTILPTPVGNYLSMVAPTFLNTPAQGPYNMTYIIGDYSRVSWPEQAHVDYISEMSNRRVWTQNTGSTYNNSSSQ